MTKITPHPHQQEALDAIAVHTADKGRVVMPTGAGKTLVEAFVLRDAINDHSETRIHLVLAPRIALVNQLIREYRNFAGQNYIAVAFHSGTHEPDYTKVKWSETSTTRVDNVKTELDKAEKLGKDLVIFSTYASCHKLIGFNFTTLIADESQYCTAENFFDSIRNLSAARKLFFTATERHALSAAGRGLNNVDVFGEVIYQVAPQTLIDGGYIVAPRLHVMSASAKSDGYTVIDEVINAATKQVELSESMPVRKVLFAMNGTADVASVVENVDRIKAALPGYTIFTIVSNSRFGAMIDGNKIKKGNWMKELRDCDNALIFHYDILSEGIDIDGITGVVLLRNMQHAKLLQTIGRAVRVYKANPSAKPYAWVTVVSINGNDESRDHVASVFNMIRSGGFDANVETVKFTDTMVAGIAEDDELEDLVGLDRAGQAKATLEGIIHEIETAEAINTLRAQSITDIAEDF
jgi:superfamily II DNA or RNA helicase